jgi:hypothetical protein
LRNTLPPLASNDLLCGADFDKFDAGCRGGNRKAIFAETFDVKLNSFLDELEDFIASFRDRHTTRQIRHMCPETGFALFYHDGIFHSDILFQSGLFENTVKRPWRNVDVGFASNRHSSALRLMFELAVATFRSRQMPTILFKQPDEIADFHARIIGAFSEVEAA